jgi:superfamily II DNA helicase RecQ
MGIDQADVRCVVNWGLVKTLETYYQQTGRAGRDGERADCYLMYTYADKNKSDSMILKSDGDERVKAEGRQQLLQMISCAENGPPLECQLMDR